MAPKGKKGAAPVVTEATEDPFVAPEGIPDSCPFEIEWFPGVVVVQMGKSLDEMSIKQKLLATKSCKCMHMLLETNNVENSAEPSELKASILEARSELAPGTSLPPDILRQVCELRWSTDRDIGWQQEWARRQTALQAAETAFEAAEARVVETRAQLEDATTALLKGITVQNECGIVLTPNSEGMPCTGEDEEPCEPLVPLWNAEQNSKSALATSEASLSNCKKQLEDLSTGQNKRWCKTQLYWTKGLAGTADELRALLQAGFPVVAAVYLHSAVQKSEEAVTGETEDPMIFEVVTAEHQRAAWDDVIMQIATIDVLSGGGGGQFVDLALCKDAENGDGSDVIEGAHEMAEALQRVSECLPAYRAWRAEHILLALPEVAVELGHYYNLLDTVPQEQQSIAVLLHCLIEQVACSSSSTDDSQCGSLEAMQGLRFIDAALQNVADPVLISTSPPCSAQHVITIVEGDLPQMASHGLLTGLVKVTGNDGGALNVQAVEERLANTVWSQWKLNAESASNGMNSLVRESMLQASAAQAGVDWSAMQLFNRMVEVANVLPSRSRALHHEELQRRHHVVDSNVSGTVASVCDAMHSLPQYKWGAMQLSKDRILVCHGGCMRQDEMVNVPHYVTQSEFVIKYLSSAPDYRVPCVSRTVYPLSMKDSTVKKDAVNAYLSNGSWVQADRDGCARMTCGSAQVRTAIGRKAQMTVSGRYGMHAVFLMHELKKPAQQVIEPGAVEQPADDAQSKAGTEGAKPASEGEEASHTPSAASSRPVTPMIRNLTVTVPMACGKLAVMHTEGILVYRITLPASAACAQQWYAVFHDGSIVVPSNDGCILRCIDGSTCEKGINWVSAEAPGSVQLDLISTMLDGKRFGISLLHADETPLDTLGEACAKVPETEGSCPDAPHQRLGDIQELQPVPHSVSVDAEVKAVTTTRSDNTMHVAYETGDSVVMWPDGSRTTKWSDGTWVVEIPGLPCVHGHSDKIACEVAPDSDLVWYRESQAISVEQAGSCSVVACPDGAFTACLNSADSQMQAAARQMILHRDSTWDPKAAAGKAPFVFTGDLNSGHWVVQDDSEQSPSTAVGFNGTELYGFESATVSARDAAHSDDEGSIEGHGQSGEGRPEHCVQPAAVDLPPRVFIINEKGTSMEILPQEAYEVYVAQNRGKQGVIDTQDSIPGTGIVVHRFVKEYEEVKSSVQPLLVSEGAVVSSPEVARAVSALKIPCKSQLRPCAGLMLPRVAAPSQQIAAHLDVKPLLLTCKEFLVYSTTGQDVEKFLELHKQSDEQLQQMNSDEAGDQEAPEVCPLLFCITKLIVKPSFRGCKSSAMQAFSVSTQQQSLVNKLRGLELDAQERARDLAKQQEKEQRATAGKNIMRELDMVAQKAGVEAANSKIYRAWKPDVGEFDTLPQLPQPGQMLKYFSCEDGIKALRSSELQQSTGAQEYERLQERLRNMAPSSHFAERGIYGVVDHGNHSDVEAEEEQQQAPAQTCAEEATEADTQYDGERHAATDITEECPTLTVPDRQAVGVPQHDYKGSSRVKLPKIYRQQKASCRLNDEYLKREYMTQRLVKTSAAELIRARGRDDVEFELGCDLLDFGELKQGDAPIVRKIPLQNVSLERARFSVDPVELPLKVAYQRGPVPAGLKTQLVVEFSAAHLGNYRGEIVVRSPMNVLKCMVSACVTRSE